MSSHLTAESRALANVDAERSILGAILLDNGVLYQAAALPPQIFSLSAHQLIWTAMLDLQASSSPIDVVTLAEALGKIKAIEKVGGVSYISSLMDGTPERSSIEPHVKIIRDKAHRRWLVERCQSAIAKFTDDSSSTSDGMEVMEDAALQVRADAGVKSSHHVREIVPEVLAELEAIRRMQGLIGFTTGIPSVDKATTGIRNDEYWVVGARPSRGKTVLGVQIAATNAELGVPVLVFSFEMTRRQIVRRMIPRYSGIPAYKIRNPRYCSEDEMRVIKETGARITQWPFWVVDPDGMKASELVAAAKLHIHRYGVKLIVVDYLQIVRGPQRELKERVAQASNMLRSIPKTEGVPVIALSQLRRLEDENARPSMADLKESGDIEAHGHTILLLYRPREDAEWTGEDEVIIAKQREGLVGSEAVVLSAEKLWFEQREKGL